MPMNPLQTLLVVTIWLERMWRTVAIFDPSVSYLCTYIGTYLQMAGT